MFQYLSVIKRIRETLHEPVSTKIPVSAKYPTMRFNMVIYIPICGYSLTAKKKSPPEAVNSINITPNAAGMKFIKNSNGTVATAPPNRIIIKGANFAKILELKENAITDAEKKTIAILVNGIMNKLSILKTLICANISANPSSK